MLENVKKSAHSSSMHFLTEFFFYLFYKIVSRHVEVIFHRSILADVKVKVTFTLHMRRDSHDDIAQKLGNDNQTPATGIGMTAPMSSISEC